ncbi:F0F1 ATP synthase subunit B [Actinomyces mediterranea]|uniref:F0F1 ATP synthase subunit B n=1 Tax=Actinomyces mediterranea TaxID=1871028 RepID=UPI000970FA4E|nr:F0F1 ATP synthase subunit B [Actinomyces mediterranea]
MRQVFAASEEAVGGLAVVLPPLYEIFWAALVLLVVLLLIGRFALPRLYATMDERQARIADGLAAADKAKEERAAAAREREDILRAANADAHSIREKATEEAAGIIAAARTEAQSEAARILDVAQRQILAEKQAAQISLRADVGLLATELAEKIVGEHLADTALTSRVVDRFLDDLEADTARASEVGTR